MYWRELGVVAYHKNGRRTTGCDRWDVTQDLAIIRIQLLSTVILSAFYSFREHWN